MDLSDNSSGGRFDEANKVFENALKMLENIGDLAKIIFTVNDLWSIDIVNKFDKAHDGFVEYWRDNHHKEFETRFDALQLAFFCDVFRRLFVDKQLKESKIEYYFTLILPELTKCIRENEKKYDGEISSFVTVMLRFDNRQSDIIVQNLFAQRECKTEKIDNEDIVKWLTDVRKSSMQQPLTITSNSMIMAATIIKEIYCNRFEKYDPFYLGINFDMKLWIPLKLVVVGDKVDNAIDDPFELIDNSLSKHNIAVITGKLIDYLLL
jgi:hypothetical protein